MNRLEQIVEEIEEKINASNNKCKNTYLNVFDVFMHALNIERNAYEEQKNLFFRRKEYIIIALTTLSEDRNNSDERKNIYEKYLKKAKKVTYTWNE